MTFNAASRLRSLEDRSTALGSRRCELPGMHSVPKSAVLPYASGVGGLSRRLLNIFIYRYMYAETETKRDRKRKRGKVLKPCVTRWMSSRLRLKAMQV